MVTRSYKKPISRRKLGDILFTISVFTLPIIIFLVFWLYVNFDSLLLAFQKEEYVNGNLKLTFTLDNFKRMFADFFETKVLLIGLKNTALFYLLSVFGSLPLAILFSYFIYKRIFGYKIFRVIVYLPCIITGAALVALYKYTFTIGSVYDKMVSLLGKEFVDLFAGKKAINMLLIYNLIFGLGGTVVILSGAMNSIDVAIIESGEIDGCNWVQELIYIIMPMVWPTISTILILGLASSMAATGPILAMTPQNPDTFTISYILYAYATGVGGHFGQDIYYASAVGLFASLIMFPIVLACRKVLNKVGDE